MDEAMRNHAQVTDAELVAFARAGSVGAFEELVDRHYGPVQRYLWRLTGDHEWTRDLAQETFLDAYRAMENLPEDRPFRSWLLVIARNNYRTEHRRRRILQIFSLNRLGSLLGSHLPVFRVEDESETIAERDQLEEALAQLSPTLREPVVLLSLGFEMEEIADLLDIEHATLRQRISRGLRRLRQAYDELEQKGGDR